MIDKLHFAVCEAYSADFAAALRAEGLNDVKVVSFPALCTRGRLNRQNWPEVLSAKGLTANNLVVVHGACNPQSLLPFELQKARFIFRRDCLQYWVGEKFLDDVNRTGGYIVTAGWLTNWRSSVDEWGFDAEGLKRFFSEFAQRIIVLDTGVLFDCRQQAINFSQTVGLPHEVVSVDLMYLRLLLRNIWLEWQLDKKEKSASVNMGGTLSSGARTNAEYAKLLDVVNQLADALTEEDIVKQLLENVALLLRPKKTGYFCLTQILDIPDISSENRDLLEVCFRQRRPLYVFSAGGKGFLVRLEYRGEVYGVLEVDELAFPEYRDHYLGWVINMANVSGLAISNARRAEEVLDIYAKLNYANSHDNLTGSCNRQYFESQFELMRDRKDILSVGVFVCDVDGLKGVNDTVGYTAGDQLIMETAQLLFGCFRENDVVARMGDGKFFVLLPNCTNEMGAMFMDHIDKSIEAYNEEAADLRGRRRLSISMGLAIGFNPGLDMGKLLKDAEAAMDRSKQAEKPACFF